MLYGGALSLLPAIVDECYLYRLHDDYEPINRTAPPNPIDVYSKVRLH